MHVVVGVMFNQQGEVLIAQRPKDKPQGGLWEFPGGKLQPNELPFQGLKRELMEELAVEVTAARRLIQKYFEDDRSGKNLLDAWQVEKFSGTPRGAEGQIVRWINITMLYQFQFPTANKEIIEKLLIQI